MLEDYNQLLIESYKEQTASWKHEDNILYRFGAVMLPVSFAALGIPYIENIKEPNLTIFETISTIGGIVLMTFWVCYVYATHAKVMARFQIINQIEEDWKVKGHKDVPKIRDDIFKAPDGLQLKTHFLETRIFNVYLIVAFLLTVCHIYYKFHICKNLAIAYLLPVLAIILCAVIADQYECSIRRGEKRLECLRNSQQT